MDTIPATILTGFLGSGKTTLLKRILTEAHGQRIAVIENEFGEENIDAELLVADLGDQVIQMSNGCICCSIREDLRITLCSLAERRRSGELAFERVVIETTGLADPGPLAQTFLLDASVAASYRPDAILTMVDAAHAMRQLDERHEARCQVGFADHIFISKADLVDTADLRELESRLQQMNPQARRRLVHFGDAALSDVFDLRGFTPSPELELEAAEPGLCHNGPHDHIGHHHADDVQSFVFRAAPPLHPGRFGQVLGALSDGFGPQLLRYKGVLHMAGTDRKVLFQGVHQLMTSGVGPVWATDEARCSRIVFIGIKLPQAMILDSLERCVLRDPVDRQE